MWVEVLRGLGRGFRQESLQRDGTGRLGCFAGFGFYCWVWEGYVWLSLLDVSVGLFYVQRVILSLSEVQVQKERQRLKFKFIFFFRVFVIVKVFRFSLGEISFCFVGRFYFRTYVWFNRKELQFQTCFQFRCVSVFGWQGVGQQSGQQVIYTGSVGMEIRF